MNLGDLQFEFENAPTDLPLVFVTDEGPIGAGYHVTELKLANIVSIDCGAQVERWSEATLQLLDGHGSSHMPVGKFRKIVDQSAKAVEGLLGSPLRVEFAHRNAGLQIFEIAKAVISDNNIALSLVPHRAVCKPAMRMAGVGAECCGATDQYEGLLVDAASTQVGGVNPEDKGCCGGPAGEGVDVCCVRDADAKAAGQPGCGCGSESSKTETRDSSVEQTCCG